MRKTLVVLALLLAVQMYAGVRVYFLQSHELQEARETIKGLEASQDFLATRVIELAEEAEILKTPRHWEALRLVNSWKEVCSRIPAGKIMSRDNDYGCAMALNNKDFPSRAALLQLLKDPELVIGTAKMYLVEKCGLVPEDERPAICAELTGQLPARP